MKNYTSFIRTVRLFYKKHKRDLLWRKNPTPYEVFVSEMMLQQTQVSRVLIKYPSFIKKFPSFKALSSAPLSQILKEWQGMGYNRRALYLKQTANIVVKKYLGKLPQDQVTLKTFPGIGQATAASIVVFSWNKPLIFIETNIRRVFIHHFFQDSHYVDDKELYPFIEKTLDYKNPREWYYALMDYGSILPRHVINPNQKSKHYVKQSKFKGSDRQIRGQILRLLLAKKPLSELNIDVIRLKKIADSLIKEGLIKENKGKYSI